MSHILRQMVNFFYDFLRFYDFYPKNIARLSYFYYFCIVNNHNASVAELVDASVSKTDGCESVPVRFRPGVQFNLANNLLYKLLAFFILGILSAECQQNNLGVENSFYNLHNITMNDPAAEQRGI
jgi:hypothetical protein